MGSKKKDAHDPENQDSWLFPEGDLVETYNGGAMTESISTEGMTYTFDELTVGGYTDMFDEQLREKYPALQQAYEHYQSVKKMCEQREKEENED